MEDQILLSLAEKPSQAKALAKLTNSSVSDVNRLLYSLENSKVIADRSISPPLWRATNPETEAKISEIVKILRALPADELAMYYTQLKQ